MDSPHASHYIQAHSLFQHVNAVLVMIDPTNRRPTYTAVVNDVLTRDLNGYDEFAGSCLNRGRPSNAAGVPSTR
jgi:hypothetical protein